MDFTHSETLEIGEAKWDFFTMIIHDCEPESNGSLYGFMPYYYQSSGNHMKMH